MSERARLEEILKLFEPGDRDLLDELHEEGLFELEEFAPDEAEELRVAVRLMHDLGVNAAGVGVVLQMRRRLVFLEGRVRELVTRLLAEMDRG